MGVVVVMGIMMTMIFPRFPSMFLFPLQWAPSHPNFIRDLIFWIIKFRRFFLRLETCLWVQPPPRRYPPRLRVQRDLSTYPCPMFRRGNLIGVLRQMQILLWEILLFPLQQLQRDFCRPLFCLLVPLRLHVLTFFWFSFSFTDFVNSCRLDECKYFGQLES